MSAPASADDLLATLDAVRESLDAEARREMEAALEDIGALREEKERYAEFFRYAPDAYVVTDAGGNVQEANEAALELLRTDSGSLVGRPLGRHVEQAGLVPLVELAARALLLKTGAAGLCWRLRPLG